ncbi:MAG: hypothetical protein WDZ75_01280 [Candidatus Paceibacterota bacterium]
MRKLVSLLHVSALSFVLAGNCSTFQTFFPLSYELSTTVTSDFVLHATNSEEIWNTTEVYIESEGWRTALDSWTQHNPKAESLEKLIPSIDLYFRKVLFDCYGSELEGEQYSPPWHLKWLHQTLLSTGCACFGELTNNLFVGR